MKYLNSILLLLLAGTLSQADPETLAPLESDGAPQTFEALWSGFNPRAEPLDVEVLQEWEEDGVVLKVVRYRIGFFKGRKAMMAGVYGYPKGGEHLPALLNIHGGGQFADYRSVLTNANRGYATLSIAWAGRISAPNYKVNSDIVKLFWANDTENPKYQLTTDWGELDAYHAPCRNPKNGFANTNATDWTLDTVDSPRNNPWFLVTLGARRGLTFLERQPQVDGSRLGVYGHSMGGKLTVLTTAADSRVKASAPSCGGVSNRNTDNALYNATVADDVSLEQIDCPILFLSPANDFHGRIDDLQTALTEIKSKDWRVVCAPHANHQDTGEFMISGLLWMDQHLKDGFALPQTPVTKLDLKTQDGVPSFVVKPDSTRTVLSVDVYYTQQGQIDGLKDDRNNTKNRFWQHAAVFNKGEAWGAKLPLYSIEKPLWVYANIAYALDEPESGASYYYGVYTTETFELSSPTDLVTPEQLQQAGVKATLKTSSMIEAFEPGWEKEWFTYSPADWGRKTHKIYDQPWQAPSLSARLAIEVRAEEANQLVISLDSYAAVVNVPAGMEWQSFVLPAADFKNAADVPMSDWSGAKELRLQASDRLSEKVAGENVRKTFGGEWSGAKPEFRNLRWLD
ncbi:MULTISPECIES: dienelactone hydrolase family protein [unclassified Lentimonas]|uniref:dienelactone hydrolase family protein n=1 Tax=unclassified Lentimonas TaxID=2630993 RepID=UPI001325969D|nr:MULTISPECIES: dienelactone hydrolase family protein [unclassified Lentimonas]CAA6692466.1 Unannotated [Lentimonas sp. CC19]CAA6693457.1 Unannotated [Lentimonas sp. CC10]CAA7070786.1 Unannotated [Lentimonas sp. CC11]